MTLLNSALSFPWMYLILLVRYTSITGVRPKLIDVGKGRCQGARGRQFFGEVRWKGPWQRDHDLMEVWGLV